MSAMGCPSTAIDCQVLLDFGLCKRLDTQQHVAFCQLVHALEELDGDLLLASLLGLGFAMTATEVRSPRAFSDPLLIASECH